MLRIQQGMPIRQLQENFNKCFPFLRLEFFKKTHNTKETSPKKELVPAQGVLKHKSRSKEVFIVESDLRVSALGELLRDQFGLHVQVFRRSGRSWLETSLTDDWSLKKQNQEGMELSFLNKD